MVAYHYYAKKTKQTAEKENITLHTEWDLKNTTNTEIGY